MSVCALQAELLHLRVKVKVVEGSWKVKVIGHIPKIFALHKFANGFITVQRENTQVYLTMD